MAGFVTERDLPTAEEGFPGITDLYIELAGHDRPITFLNLLKVWIERDRQRREVLS